MAGRFVILGAGGACLELDEPFSVGSLLKLSFTLPKTGDTIDCRAIVRDEISRTSVGVEFLDISPQDRERVSACVQRYIKAGFADERKNTV